MARRFTPFNQSLINQGMNQTNRFAANATSPANITNPPFVGNQGYTTFNNNNMNPGGGNVMGGSGFGPGSDMLGTGNVSGSGYGGNIGQYDIWGEGVQGHMGFGGSLGGDAYDDYLAEQEWLASDEYALQQQGITINPDGTYGIYSPWLQSGGLYGDVWQQSGMSNSFSSSQEALDAITNLQSLQELNESGFYDELVPGVGDPIPGSEQSLTGGFDFGSGFGSGPAGWDFNPAWDVNGDGLVDTLDLQQMASQGVSEDELQSVVILISGEGPTPSDSATGLDWNFDFGMGWTPENNPWQAWQDAQEGLPGFDLGGADFEFDLEGELDLSDSFNPWENWLYEENADAAAEQLENLGSGWLEQAGLFDDLDIGVDISDINFGEGIGVVGDASIESLDLGTGVGTVFDNPNNPYYQAQQALIDAQQQAPTNIGGGGQGGQAARRLYYPGTSGGFASVGSGIGGGNNTLQELLKGLG